MFTREVNNATASFIDALHGLEELNVLEIIELSTSRFDADLFHVVVKV